MTATSCRPLLLVTTEKRLLEGLVSCIFLAPDSDQPRDGKPGHCSFADMLAGPFLILLLLLLFDLTYSEAD